MASIFKKAKDRSSKDKGRSSSNSFNNPLNAPTEVAQAINSHIARNNNELSFKKGDFFHVISNLPLSDGTIEIFDPVNNVHGKAPLNCFKLFEKTHRPNDSDNRISNDNNNNTSSSNNNSHSRHVSSNSLNSNSLRSTSSTKKDPIGNLFGVVLYDFKAERSDELSVNAGDSIFICAHHDYEWYIAKFLNKVGEVGLVPVSYVQLIDAVTRIPYKESPKSIIDHEHLPTVDEWKLLKNKHKASSRSVGQHDSTNNNSLSRNSSINNIIPINTNIESFSSTNNKFWFLIRVTMSDNSIRSLCRYYEDFFNFHQKLLSTWPREGGKFDTKDKKERILPFIPGPVIDVTESLCHKRLIDLNEYLSILLKLPDYISKSNLVLSFFNLLDGDEILNDSNNSNNTPVEPHRPAPNLKIINSDNSHNRPQSHPQQQQQQQQQQQRVPSETLSQSNYDRRSQYEIINRSNSVSNKVSEFNSTRKSSSASLLSQNQSQNQSQILSQTQPQQPSSNSNTNSSKLKLKFYYNDDIFAIIVPSNVTLSDLKSMIIPKLDECDSPNIESKIELYSKNSVNIDQSNYVKSQLISNDNDLWNDPNFVDKGKFLIIVL